MVKRDPLDALHHALSDPKRRLMVERLRLGPMSVSTLAEPLGVTLAAVGKHLAVLEEAGLVRTHKDGRVRVCTLDLAPLALATRWIEEQQAGWHARVDALVTHLEENP